MRKNSALFKVIKVISFILSIVLLGSLGYYIIEDYTPLDAVYMTVITLTTTGYGEVVPLTTKGRIFTMILLLVGMGIVTYSISSIATYVFSIDFSMRRREKMEKQIKRFKGHTIVCGYGRMGEIICRKLSEERVPFVVIERRENLIKLLQIAKYPYIEGDASNDDNLEKASIENAKVLVSVIDNDSDALYITLAARSFNPSIHIIARANEQNAKKRMLRAGANQVILPFVMSGIKVAESIINPAVHDFLSFEEFQDQGHVNLGDLYVSEESTIPGKSIKEIGETIKKLIIVGIKKSNNEFIFYPKGDYKFEQGDSIITMGEQNDFLSMKELYKLSTIGFYETKAEQSLPR